MGKKGFSSYRVYGKDGHRQRASFNKSTILEFNDGTTMIFACSDVIDTHDYVLVTIYFTDKEIAKQHLCAQLFDGFFENCNFGNIKHGGGYDLGNLW